MVGGRAQPFFQERLGVESGDLEGPVTERYAALEMLMQWGVTPDRFDALPRSARLEMMLFWAWRSQRLAAAHKTSTLNAKYYPHGSF